MAAGHARHLLKQAFRDYKLGTDTSVFKNAGLHP